MPRRMRLAPHLTGDQWEARYRWPATRSSAAIGSLRHFLWLLAGGMTATTVAVVTGYSAYSASWIGQIARGYTRDGPASVHDRRQRAGAGEHRLLCARALALSEERMPPGFLPDGGTSGRRASTERRHTRWSARLDELPQAPSAGDGRVQNGDTVEEKRREAVDMPRPSTYQRSVYGPRILFRGPKHVPQPLVRSRAPEQRKGSPTSRLGDARPKRLFTDKTTRPVAITQGSVCGTAWWSRCAPGGAATQHSG
jgi:hypothetical protein